MEQAEGKDMKAVVLGATFAGVSAACALAEMGYDVSVVTADTYRHPRQQIRAETQADSRSGSELQPSADRVPHADYERRHSPVHRCGRGWQRRYGAGIIGLCPHVKNHRLGRWMFIEKRMGFEAAARRLVFEERVC